jgi:hypothetical protein
MDRQGRTGDTMLDKSREIRGRTQTQPSRAWWLGGEGVNSTDTNYSTSSTMSARFCELFYTGNFILRGE